MPGLQGPPRFRPCQISLALLFRLEVEGEGEASFSSIRFFLRIKAGRQHQPIASPGDLSLLTACQILDDGVRLAVFVVGVRRDPFPKSSDQFHGKRHNSPFGELCQHHINGLKAELIQNQQSLHRHW